MNEQFERRLKALERRMNIISAAGFNPLAYGHIYAATVAQTVTISDSSNYFEITAGWTEGDVLNCSHSAGRIDCVNPGLYLCVWSLTLYVNSTNNTIGAAPMLEGSVHAGSLCRVVSPGTANYYFHLGGVYIETIATANTGTSLGIRNFTAANNVVFDSGTLVAYRIV